jgi:Zn-dependent protease
VAGAGPASNAVIAILGGIVIRLNIFAGAADIVFLIVIVNVMLCIFNLIPIPPLDGSKVLEALLPRSLQYGYARWRRQMEMNPIIGMVIVVIIILLLGGAFSTFIYDIASFLAGVLN